MIVFSAKACVCAGLKVQAWSDSFLSKSGHFYMPYDFRVVHGVCVFLCTFDESLHLLH